MPDPASTESLSAKFMRVHDVIRPWEGGYANDPADPGGPTNFGITQATLAAWRGKSVTPQEVQQLPYTEALQIFAKHYWTPIRGEELPDGADLVTYNSAVNMGPNRAGLFLQRALRKQGFDVGLDGAIGPQTLAAAAQADKAALVLHYTAVCRDYYVSLPTFEKFGKGWMNRLTAVSAAAAKMAGEAPANPNNGGAPVANQSSSTDQIISTIDKVVGGQALTGKKTLIGGLTFAGLSILEAYTGVPVTHIAPVIVDAANTTAPHVPPVDQMTNWIDAGKDVALALGGLGVAAKLDRGLKLFAKFATVVQN